MAELKLNEKPDVMNMHTKNSENDSSEVKITSQQCSTSEDAVKIVNKTDVKVESVANNEESIKVEGNKDSDKVENTVMSEDTKNVKDNKNQEVVLEEEEEEEDVPANFFDDLMNEDFIDGLNVVDAWDESDTLKVGLKMKDQKSPIRFPSKSPNAIFKPMKIASHTRQYRERDPLLPSPKRQKSELDNKQKHKPKMKKIKRNTSEVDVRRDPNKTKRDIQKHKDKCAKDEEARIISEKLKVCETGLVPPGTETEIDLENFSVKKDETDEAPQKTIDEFIAKYGNRRSRSLERILERRKLETIRDLERLSMERRSLERRFKTHRSLERRSMERRRNYLRGRSRSRTPRRRSPIYNNERRKIEERKSEGRIRARHQSKSRDDISISPSSNISAREAWLKRKSRGMSRSPSLSKRSRSFLKELDRLSKPRPKKSFLKELEEKLYPLDIVNAQASNVVSHQSIPLQPMMHPIPAAPLLPNFPIGPVPPPMPVPHPTFPPVQQEYDQQFFIGPQPDIQFGVNDCPPGSYQQGGFLPQGPVTHSFPQPHPIAFPHTNLQINPTSMNLPVQMSSNLMINTSIQQHQVIAKDQGGQNLDAYKKLLEEKKITLSDFLSLTANFSDNTKPIDIKNKIKVITRCQEAIKELSEDAKMGGSFVLRKIRKASEKLPEVVGKIQSPYRKIAAVRFSFSTPMKQQNEERSYLSLALNRLLMKIGNEPIFNTPKESPVSSEDKVPLTLVQRSVKPVLMQKFVQTENYKCEECEARKSTKFYSVSSQTVNVLTFDVSCQVSDEIFQKPLKSILKNQSLAHLTPAQLLAAQSAEDDSLPRDLFSSGRKKSYLLETPTDLKQLQTGPFLADRIANFDLTTNRFSVANPNTFDLDRHERFTPESERERFHKPTISPNRLNFERQALPPPTGRAGPFSHYSSRLNFEPPPISTYAQKSRNVGQSIDNSRPFFEPPFQGSVGFQQEEQRF